MDNVRSKRFDELVFDVANGHILVDKDGVREEGCRSNQLLFEAHWPDRVKLGDRFGKWHQLTFTSCLLLLSYFILLHWLSLSFVMADIQAVLNVLSAFNQPSDKNSFEKANAWLQDFQHSVNTLSPLVPASNAG